MSRIKVLHGNNIELLKEYPDNYFDVVVTDPPYGLGKEPDTAEMLKAWLEHGYMEVKGSGFMGKEWDAFVPQPIFWKEVFRVLKHGGHVLAFYGTRTYDWGVMAMRLAGFEVRDCIQWLYGSGFPKSYNVAKGIEGKIVNGSSSWNDWKKLDGEKEQVNWGYSKGQAEQGYRGDYSEANKERVGKVNFQSEQAKLWDGWGSALKPANEPIVLARKPLEKGLSIAENVLKWGTGAINIDGCRVGSQVRTMPIFSSDNKSDTTTFNLNSNIQHHREETTQGRFPANLILTHHPECECIGTKKVGSGKDGGYNYEGNVYEVEGFVTKNSPNANSNYGKEKIENWNCHEDCPIRLLDEQSGENNDKGGASRFFYVAKASKSERNKGLDDFDAVIKSDRKAIDNPGADNPRNRTGTAKINHHPTVKPIKLMQYLIKLVTPENGIVLDPFCGSGTTGIACKLEGFDFVGMEQDAEYTKIAQARIDNYVSKNKNETKENRNIEIKYQQIKLF